MLTGLKKDDSVVFQYLVSLSPMIRELSFGPWAHRYPASFVARSSPWLRPGHKDVSEVMWAVFRIWLKGREHVMRFSLCPTRAGWDADLGGESHLEQHGWGQYLGLIEWQLGKNSGCWHHGTIIRRPRLLIPGLLGKRQICFLLKPLFYFLSSYLYAKIANEHIKIYSIILINTNETTRYCFTSTRLAKILKSDTINC